MDHISDLYKLNLMGNLIFLLRHIVSSLSIAEVPVASRMQSSFSDEPSYFRVEPRSFRVEPRSFRVEPRSLKVLTSSSCLSINAWTYAYLIIQYCIAL